jgi:hypothetical protein
VKIFHYCDCGSDVARCYEVRIEAWFNVEVY